MQDKPENPSEDYFIAYDLGHVDYTLIISRRGREVISKVIEPSRYDCPQEVFVEEEEK